MRYDDHPEASGEPARFAPPIGTSGPTGASPSPARAKRSDGSATTADGPGFTVLDHLTPAAMRFLDARGLDTEVSARMGLSTARSRDGGEWLAIPYVVDGQTINHKYRCLSAKRFAQDKGARQTWWNYDAIADPGLTDHPLIVTEGELDALAAMSAGHLRVLSVPSGAPSSPTESNAKYAFLADSLADLADCRSIVLATDGDASGQALQHDLAIRLGRGRCKSVELPPGCKDLNDVLIGYGEAGVTAAIAAAKYLHVPGLFRMSELPPVPDPVPMPTMLPGMADHYRIRRGDFAVVTGIPGSGKSTLVNDICCRMAECHGWNSCLASFEQHPRVDHLRALRTWKTRRPDHCNDPSGQAEADAWIDRHFSFVVPGEGDQEPATLDWILERMATAVIRFGADICVIDPWNEIDHHRPKDMLLTEYVGRSIRELKQFARRWNVHLIVVAHPAKMLADRDGNTRMPTLYDISDSANWFNKPDVGMIVHPTSTEELGPHTVLWVQKSRYHDKIGKPGSVRLSYSPSTARFEAAG